jgi:hypothetical protein
LILRGDVDNNYQTDKVGFPCLSGPAGREVVVMEGWEEQVRRERRAAKPNEGFSSAVFCMDGRNPDPVK